MTSPRRHLSTAVVTAEQPSATASDSAGIDAATINRARLGDAAAFTRIVEAYYPRCMRFARSMMQEPDEAEDMVQEAFVRVYKALPRYQERQRFESWLFHILANCCRSANKRFRRQDADSLHGTDLEQRLPSDDRADARIEGEMGPAVRRALSEVPAHNREVFLLHYVEGFSYEEMERITGVRRSALKMRVKRASDQLRARLAGVARD